MHDQLRCKLTLIRNVQRLKIDDERLLKEMDAGRLQEGIEQGVDAVRLSVWDFAGQEVRRGGVVNTVDGVRWRVCTAVRGSSVRALIVSLIDCLEYSIPLIRCFIRLTSSFSTATACVSTNIGTF